MIYRFMDDQRRFHRVEMMAGVLEVSRSGYFQWRHRQVTNREKSNKKLRNEIKRIQKKAKWRYGSPRVTRQLRKRGIKVGENRVARIMRAEGLNRRRRKKFRVTTRSAHKHAPAQNLLDRQFSVAMANRVWISDLTYVATGEGWLYLCVILDLYSRRVVGWSMSESLATDMVLRAFWPGRSLRSLLGDASAMAVNSRRPPQGLIFHSDRGVQYASGSFRRALVSCRMRQSMSRRGDCWDNGVPRTPKGDAPWEMGVVWPPGIGLQDRVPNYIELPG